MEGESSGLHSEENKDMLKKNPKRRLKTPAQVMALEKFYSENKYPPEEMRSQLAEQLGLTEKQISGWFCHRRLKDKRTLGEEANANVRQDLSSGVIQDRGSGLGQDSCGSTKEAHNWHMDPREVQSRRPYSHDFPPTEFAVEHRNLYTENMKGKDDTSSESSSSLQDGLLSQSQHPTDVGIPRYLANDVAIPPRIPKTSNMTGYKPSGYLKVKGDIENAAITAVKRQLGMHYREDGPPLGVEFDPLPPGSFKAPVHDTYYDVSTVLPNSPDVSLMKKQSTSTHGHNSHMGDNQPSNSTLVSEGQDRKIYYQPKRVSNVLNCGNSLLSQKCSSDLYKHSVGDSTLENGNRRNRMSSSIPGKRMKADSSSNFLGGHVTKSSTEQKESWPNNRDGLKKVPRGDYSKARLQNLAGSNFESFDAEEEKFNEERKVVKDNGNPVRVKKNPTKERRVAKRAKVTANEQDCVTKVPRCTEIPELKKHSKRPVMQMPSSFSEDETAETSSSLG